MRLNIYSQELITDNSDIGLVAVAIESIRQEANTGVVYSAVRLFLHSSDRLHHPPNDDDRSAITFWLPKSKDRREFLAIHFEALAQLIRKAEPETGLD